MIKTFTDILKIKYLKKSIPLYCHWEVTFRCNLRCPFCTLQSGKNIWQPELTTIEAIDILKQVKDMGSKIIHFVGGEPTIRNDLDELAELAKQYKMMTMITSNGYVKNINTLKKIDLVRISLTRKIDKKSNIGLNPVETLEELVLAGKTPSITTTISTETKDSDIDFILGLARRLKIKVGFYYVDVGLSHLNCFSPTDLEKRKEELQHLIIPRNEVLEKINNLYTKNKDVVLNQNRFFQMIKKGGLSKYGCRAMDTAICIKANGQIAMPCIEFPHKTPKGKLSEVYNSTCAKECRKEQGEYWFCKECGMSCMYSASTLLSIIELFSTVKKYIKQII